MHPILNWHAPVLHRFFLHGGDTLIRPYYTWLTSIQTYIFINSKLIIHTIFFSHTTLSLYLLLFFSFFSFFFLRNQIGILLNITKEHQSKHRIWHFLAKASATQLQLRLTWQKQKKLELVNLEEDILNHMNILGQICIASQKSLNNYSDASNVNIFITSKLTIYNPFLESFTNYYSPIYLSTIN